MRNDRKNDTNDSTNRLKIDEKKNKKTYERINNSNI